MLDSDLEELIDQICNGEIADWDRVHGYYQEKSHTYPMDKFNHSFASLLEILEIEPSEFNKELYQQLLKESVETSHWILEQISASRTKDYNNAFRKMVYETNAEMEKVLGKLEDNNFISEQKMQLKTFEQKIVRLLAAI